MRIGIDVGGTNTDAVCMDGDKVVASTKSSTTLDVTSGIVSALKALAGRPEVAISAVKAVVIGTTHFLNAVIEASQLTPTAVLRLGLPATASIPPFTDWPAPLVAAIRGRSYMCQGGIESDGRPISALDPSEIRRAAKDMARHGIRSVAISSVFSPMDATHERCAAEIITEVLPDVAISLSSVIGRLGLLERENATIVNSAIRDLADSVLLGLSEAIRGLGIGGRLHLAQNDGTLMDVSIARNYPVFTFASGTTNSMRGAAFLSGLEHCAVVDVGGTTADVGMLVDGSPRAARAEVTIAGVRTNLRMPDVLSIGLGGGSKVDQADGFKIGPNSVGIELPMAARVFGGSTLTATDLGVFTGRVDAGERSLVADLPEELVHGALAWAADRISGVVDQMRTSEDLVPTVVVGGGAFLVPDSLSVASEVLRPLHGDVANAIGAAMAQVGGEVDRIIATDANSREAVLEDAKEEARERAVAAGADPKTLRIIDVHEIPIAYLPGSSSLVRVKAVGDLVLEE